MGTENKGTPDWEVQKRQLRSLYPWLTEEDLTFPAGKKDLMMDRLQLILGKTKPDLMKLFDSLQG